MEAVVQEPVGKDSVTIAKEKFANGWNPPKEEEGKQVLTDNKEEKAEKKEEPEANQPKEEEDFKQKWLSQQGIVKSERRKREEAENRYKELETRLNSYQDEKKKEPGKSTEQAIVEETIVDRLKKLPSIRALETEYGKEFSQALEDMTSLINDAYEKRYGDLKTSSEATIEARVKGIVENLEPKIKRLEPIAEEYQTATKAAHEQAIEEAHPDYKKYLDNVDEEGNPMPGELALWMKDHPLEDTWERYVKEGTAKQVNYMLDTFKKEKGYAVEERGIKPDKKDNLRKMESVKQKTKPVTPPSGEKKGSFTDGWNGYKVG